MVGIGRSGLRATPASLIVHGLFVMSTVLDGRREDRPKQPVGLCARRLGKTLVEEAGVPGADGSTRDAGDLQVTLRRQRTGGAGPRDVVDPRHGKVLLSEYATS
jgi:hypothetical protein